MKPTTIMPSGLKIEDRVDTLSTDGLRTNSPDCIVIHSTRTYPTFEGVLNCHRQRGFAGMGYHFFIDYTGTIYQARPIQTEGAHALGFNTHSIGISIFSKDGNLKVRSRRSGRKLIDYLVSEYPEIRIIPHLQAQVEYINTLLRNNGHKTQFQYSNDMLGEENFRRLKVAVDLYTGSLSTEKNEQIKRQLKALKNCPGALFKKLRRTR